MSSLGGPRQPFVCSCLSRSLETRDHWRRYVSPGLRDHQTAITAAVDTSRTGLNSGQFHPPDSSVTLHGRVRRGDVAGGLHHSKRRQIRIDGQLYQAARLASLYMTGEWPKHQISYVNGNRSDL